MKIIDSFLNKITMYRLILYYLIGLLIEAIFLSLFGQLSYSTPSIVFSTLFLLLISWASNIIFAKVHKAPTNVESVYITALILALIINPTANVAFLGWAAILATASKYIVTIGKKHIFNPAVFAVAITAIVINQSANWWIGTLPMLPFVIIGGILVVRKIRRPDMILSFLVFSLLTIYTFDFLKGISLVSATQKVLFDSPLLFFSFVMLTEPLTSPPTKNLQIFYAALVGFLFAPQIHIASFYSTPEIALLAGNVFSYIVSPKTKLILKLKEKIQISRNVYDFIFAIDKRMSFTPGQYMEWTLPHSHPDSRGNRRYFTIASSPAEQEVRIGVKFYANSSSFKRSLFAISSRDEIVASQLAGDFVLPKKPGGKYVFIAGGIGITPFRSMIKHLLDTGKREDIILFYSNKKANEIIYKEIFDEAKEKVGLRTFYVLTSREDASLDWNGKVSRINKEMIIQEVPNYKERIFYLSGPYSMVESFKRVLKDMKIRNNQIKTDFFPGFV